MSKTTGGEHSFGIPSSFKTRSEIEKSTNAGCFYCTKIFPVGKIKEWADDGLTPICPYCGIDSVLGDAQGVILSKEYLEDRRKESFEV